MYTTMKERELEMKRTRRKFTREFKQEAVRLVTEQGYSVKEAAENLGIGENMLRRWKNELEANGKVAFPGNGNLISPEEELRRLREENKRLRMEREILKKAAAFFAKESN